MKAHMNPSQPPERALRINRYLSVRFIEIGELTEFKPELPSGKGPDSHRVSDTSNKVPDERANYRGVVWCAFITATKAEFELNIAQDLLVSHSSVSWPIWLGQCLRRGQ